MKILTIKIYRKPSFMRVKLDKPAKVYSLCAYRAKFTPEELKSKYERFYFDLVFKMRERRMKKHRSQVNNRNKPRR